jgi:uncharacterized membrane protein YphA (DoxX/SURF4 family)
MKKSTIAEIISFLFIVLFLYTSISKLMEFSVFKHQIGASPVLSPIAWWIAWLIPALEIIVSLMLIIPAFRLRGLYASTILMIAFTAYIIIILNFSKEIPCSCGGVIEQLSWTQHIFFNSVFIVLGIIGIMLLSSSPRPRYTP